MFIQSSSTTIQPSRIANDSHNWSVPDGVSALGTTAGTTIDASPVKRVESAQPAIQQPTDAQIKEALNSINKTLKQASINLQFNVDTDTKRSVVKLVDGETG
ncbi:MAG: flagellar protein FlaG, partial [Gallionella sp.]|nr:flagellar protein FlaG [Gallionella sp.]